MAFEQPLSAEEMRRVLGAIMEGRTPPEEIRAFLTTLAERGETAEELAAAVEVLRAHVVPLPLANPRDLCDTCGTGGDGQDTLNVSTLAALVAAAAGVRVVKHGNRAASSRCGSADLLEALGVNLDASPAQVARCVDELGFGFCFAPRFHPAMKAVAPIRKELKIRTLFNLIGPLANPAPLAFQLVGVSEPRLLRPVAEALVRLGVRHGLVVHGTDGLDEVTTTADTIFVEVRDGRLSDGRFEPEELGVVRTTLMDLQGGDAAHNARVAREMLEGRPGAAADIVAANAGCALYLAGLAPTMADGAEQAKVTLAAKRAAVLLDRVKALSHAG
jgi:anthranilate phosphoribosyltransferase